MSDSGTPYIGREQTLVKHFILERYLERFAHIIGYWADAITYVDGFSGPWNVRSDDLKDSSFHLALRQLRKAHDTYRDRGRTVRIRCLFLERKPDAYQKLKAFADSVNDAEIRTTNAEFEDSTGEIIEFVQSGGPRSFPFIFVDPTGWTGFAMDRIGPLLRLNPGEVLINFMTGHIRRFIEAPDQETQGSFERLFGSGSYRQRIAGLERQEREDQLVKAYIDAVKCEVKYEYVCPAIVLHPQIDRTHFHLICATRHVKGVEVFKGVEKEAMTIMEKSRAQAQQRARVKKTGQQELPFAAEVIHDRTHYDTLRERYLRESRGRVWDLVRSKGRLPYDDLWIEALSAPLVWDSDLKGWVLEWQKSGVAAVEGLRPGERVPKRDAGHWVVVRDCPALEIPC